MTDGAGQHSARVAGYLELLGRSSLSLSRVVTSLSPPSRARLREVRSERKRGVFCPCEFPKWTPLSKEGSPFYRMVVLDSGLLH